MLGHIILLLNYINPLIFSGTETKFPNMVLFKASEEECWLFNRGETEVQLSKFSWCTYSSQDFKMTVSNSNIRHIPMFGAEI